jgi:hypothetical protein
MMALYGPLPEYPPAFASYSLYHEIAPDLAPIWADVLEQYNPYSFEYQAWLMHTCLVTLTPAAAVIGTPNWISRDKIRDCYLTELRSRLGAVLGHPVEMTVVIDKRMKEAQARRVVEVDDDAWQALLQEVTG